MQPPDISLLCRFVFIVYHVLNLWIFEFSSGQDIRIEQRIFNWTSVLEVN